MNNNEKEINIEHEFDYSNIIPTIDNIGNLIKYCESIYNQFLKLIDEDEKRNEQLKYEYKNYQYGKCYGNRFEISIFTENYTRISCKDYDSYLQKVNEGYLKNVNSLSIYLDLDFLRGPFNDSKIYENLFEISFRPYKIKFFRKSNNNDEKINQIENVINSVLYQLPKENSIFCTK